MLEGCAWYGRHITVACSGDHTLQNSKLYTRQYFLYRQINLHQGKAKKGLCDQPENLKVTIHIPIVEMKTVIAIIMAPEEYSPAKK